MDGLQPSSFYHIYNHGNGNENIFREEENYRFFLEKYDLYISPVAETFSWCLMPNHFHLLIKIKDETTLLNPAFPKFKTLEKLVAANDISRQFSNLFSSYAQAYNKKYKRMGSLFLKNFSRRIITTDSYFSKIIHYIHANPVHHGFVKAICDWHWSSYNTFLSNHPTKINRDEVLNWFGGKEGFIQFHQQPVYLKGKDMFDD
ncbi:MAG: hypothetical protein ABI813_08125 [Bacteroidota bacterium]